MAEQFKRFVAFYRQARLLGHSRSSALLLARMWMAIQKTDLPSAGW
jgi:hypothetical protein